MDISGARTLVVGATGVLGSAIATALQSEGAKLALAGRSGDFGDLAGTDTPTFTFDALDLERCANLVGEAADALGGLDLLVVAVGVAGFGEESENDVITEQLFTINTMAPMAFARAALPRLEGEGTIAVISAILADVPTPGMATYSASKAGLSAWLTAVRGEQRKKGVTVFDIRPPHIDTGLADRPVAGKALEMKAAATVDDLVPLVLQGITENKRSLSFDLKTAEFALR
ncbi:short-subunit dehydrogenase [Pseudonocardia sediminis]|uniref:Short-subunit dehydrogenase n=1 Tax=Pseudonocardia sediminis TaxID=1397368 RepID=A0A4Q7UWH2_PSEST|nr:SDR family NAD(P)-dependent oxidoreductase [Pseudonocardia sediminis]RZT85231.1 short-subunit dehydrogenase [Pseudonocardia sediminis]